MFWVKIFGHEPIPGSIEDQSMTRVRFSGGLLEALLPFAGVPEGEPYREIDDGRVSNTLNGGGK